MAQIKKYHLLFEEAKVYLNDALSFYRKEVGISHPDYGLLLNNLADIEMDRGDPVAAAAFYRQAFPILEAALGTRHHLVGILLTNWAKAVYDLGNTKEAIKLVKRAIAIHADGAGDRSEATAVSLVFLSELYYGMGDNSNAIKVLSEAHDIYSEIFGENHNAIASIRMNMGEISRRMKNYRDARKHIRVASNMIASSIGKNNIKMAPVFGSEALVEFDVGRYKAAEGLYEKAIHLAQSNLNSGHPIIAGYTFGLANALYKQQSYDRALDRIRESTSIYKVRLSNAGNNGDSIQTSESIYSRAAFLKHIQILIHNIDDENAINESLISLQQESFEVGQLARGNRTEKSILGMSSRFSAANDDLGDIVKNRQSAIAKYNNYDNSLLAALSMKYQERDIKKEGLVRKNMVLLANKINELNSRMKSEYPKFYQLMNPEPVTVKKVQNILNNNEALVTVLLGKEESYLWVIKTDGMVFKKIPVTSDEIAREVSIIRASLENPEMGQGDRSKSVYPTDVASHIYETIFGQVKDELDDVNRIIFVPDGPLFSLPLEVLLAAKPEKKITEFSELRHLDWLVDKFAFSYVPSASSLIALRELAGSSTARCLFWV